MRKRYIYILVNGEAAGSENHDLAMLNSTKTDTHQISKITFFLFQFESRHMYLSELRSIMHGRVRVT